MTIGRIFPIPNPLREFPVDPVESFDTYRDAPLPFHTGASPSANIETLFLIRPLMSVVISAILDPDNPGGGGSGSGGAVDCNPITNMYCVPTGAVVHVSVPTATVRCRIT